MQELQMCMFLYNYSFYGMFEEHFAIIACSIGGTTLKEYSVCLHMLTLLVAVWFLNSRSMCIC